MRVGIPEVAIGDSANARSPLSTLKTGLPQRPHAQSGHVASRDTSDDVTRTHALTWSNVVETTTPVEVTGRYSNRQIAQIARKLFDVALEMSNRQPD